MWRVWCFRYHGMVSHSLLFVWKEQERGGSNTHGTVCLGRVHTGTWRVRLMLAWEHSLCCPLLRAMLVDCSPSLTLSVPQHRSYSVSAYRDITDR